MLEKIVSGGQTGVDRAALDVAVELEIPHGGWCPKGRWAEDGIISPQYNLIEAATEEPSERTKLNVRDSDGTLILIKGLSIGEGTQLTIDEAKLLNKPLLIINLTEEQNIEEQLQKWLFENNICTLNIAGPRASQQMSIYELAYQLLKHFFSYYNHIKKSNSLKIL